MVCSADPSVGGEKPRPGSVSSLPGQVPAMAEDIVKKKFISFIVTVLLVNQVLYLIDTIHQIKLTSRD
jgi:hypothetical protein